jgi:hypothetical protein
VDEWEVEALRIDIGLPSYPNESFDLTSDCYCSANMANVGPHPATLRMPSLVQAINGGRGRPLGGRTCAWLPIQHAQQKQAQDENVSGVTPVIPLAMANKLEHYVSVHGRSAAQCDKQTAQELAARKQGGSVDGETHEAHLGTEQAHQRVEDVPFGRRGGTFKLENVDGREGVHDVAVCI